jgi:RNA polymerase sigma-70 factor (ECF subfamily)
MLRAWLKAQFRSEGDIDDIVQEAYLRVLQAHAAGEVHSPKAFLFATARNVMLMRLRHREVARVDALTENAFAGILDESTDVADAVARSQELELLTQAIQSLPERCRQILTLRKIYGLSQREVAAELGIAEHTVEAQGTIALRKLGEFFAQHGAAPPSRK